MKAFLTAHDQEFYVVDIDTLCQSDRLDLKQWSKTSGQKSLPIISRNDQLVTNEDIKKRLEEKCK